MEKPFELHHAASGRVFKGMSYRQFRRIWRLLRNFS
jgi:hypothetical protein